ncbi:MAG: hypothetical protein JW720_13195 [Sedimentisphaerales bacterium]|nr:hypothetical protein [Sedimentisphaerales bacterium]
MTLRDDNIRVRIRQLDKWDYFIERRKALEAQGRNKKDAWEQAAAEILGKTENEDTDEDDNFCDVDIEQFADKPTASARQIVQWVFEHIRVRNVTPDMAPSPGAYSLLLDVRNNPALRTDFIHKVWAKLLPTRAEIESSRKFEDDGRSQIQILDRIERAKREAEADSVL